MLNGNGSERSKRELAAAIGAALALSLRGQETAGSRAVAEEPAFSPWRISARREQIFSSTLGSRGWR